MTKTLKTLVAALGMMVALSLGTVASAQMEGKKSMADDPDIPLITGKHWMEATRSGKLAFLAGAANVIEIEQALQADDPPGDRDSLVPVIVRGLNGSTLTQVMEALDRWYAENKDQLERPVIETIWFELALPKS